MRRRDLGALVGGIAATPTLWPSLLGAQQKVPLLSIQLEMADTKERGDLLGPNPIGRMTITGDGRTMCILTAADRRQPTDQASTAELFGSMTAYAGKFRIEGNDKIVINCDLSWHPGWVGTEQVRFFKIEGDSLSIRSGLQTHPARALWRHRLAT